ncbi:MAG: 50S ribosomal protein L24 [Clostridiales bacterium]|nr:50S ribosomal protein L24 [Clostridiales bacterium]MCF8022396.1 50S ribosomal protein L24 [Clostridiales bacterium]
MSRPKVHVRKGDTVKIIRGKSSGKKGKVLEVQPDRNRVVIENVNKVKRHTRPTEGAPQGGIIEREAPVHASNVLLYCSKCNKPTRLGKRFLKDGKKVRYCKKCGEVLD